MEMEILWSMKCVYRFRKGVEAGVSDGGGGSWGYKRSTRNVAGYLGLGQKVREIGDLRPSGSRAVYLLWNEKRTWAK